MRYYDPSGKFIPELSPKSQMSFESCNNDDLQKMSSGAGTFINDSGPEDPKFTKEDLAFFYKEGEVQKYHDIATDFETVFQSFIARKLNQLNKEVKNGNKESNI